MGVKEKGICELDIVLRGYSCCYTVENSVVGPRYYLYVDGAGGGCCFHLLDRDRNIGRGRLAVGIALSFGHLVLTDNVDIRLSRVELKSSRQLGEIFAGVH